MPRQARIDLPGYFYHVMVRGVERRSIFRADDDRFDFLKRLAHGLTKTGARCLTWALMSNHLHLLILSGAQGLAALMHPLLTGYVGFFNRRYRRVGHLVQNRFKAILCEENPYLLELIRYIPLNPVRAGIVKTPAELARYPWTGHAAILGNATVPWQRVEDVLERFGSQRHHARRAYSTFVIDRWDQGERRDLEGGGLFRSLGGMKGILEAKASGDRQAFDAQILGSGIFVETVLKEAEQAERQTNAFIHAGLTIQKLQCLAAQVVGVNAESLQECNRTKLVSEARALFVYAATKILKRPGAEIAAWLGLRSSSVSEASQRGRGFFEKYKFGKTLGVIRRQ